MTILLVVLRPIESDGFCSMEQEWKRFHDSGRDALRDGNFKVAESMWLAALGQAENFGDKDPRFVLTLEQLADTYWFMGELTQVETLSRRLLSTYQTTLAPDHFRTGRVAHRLATLYHFQQKYGLAEPLYKQVMTIMMKWLGSNHPELARVMDDYADLLKQTHREDQAEYIKQCSESIKAGKWGAPESKSGAAQSAGRAGSDNGGGKAPNAPDAQPHVTPVRAAAQAAPPSKSETVPLPKSQPPSPTVPKPQPVAVPKPQPVPVPAREAPIHQAAAKAQTPPSRTAQAPSEPKHEPKPEPARRAESQGPAIVPNLGKNNQPAAQGATSIEHEWNQFRTMAEKATSDGDFDSAERLWTAAVKRAEKLGTHDQRLAYCLDNLADVLTRAEKFYMAEPHLKRSLDMKREVLGDGHAMVAAAANNLAKLHYMQGHYREAELYGKECIDTYERAFGSDHPDVAVSLHNLATLYHIQCKYSDAETCYRRGLTIRRKVLGDDHPDTARIKKNYADLLQTLGRGSEAAALNRKATGLITGEWSVIEIPTDESLSE